MLLSGNAAQGVLSRNYTNYYSGTDVRIYFGKYWVDEIVEIGFSLQEQVMPIFGYSSYTWDKVARGNRFVSGSFAINFKEVGYLQTILNRLASDQTNNKWFDKKDYNASLPGNKSKDGFSDGKNVETLIKNFQTLADQYENALWGESNQFTNTLRARNDNTFWYNTDADINNEVLKDNGFNILITYGENCRDMIKTENDYKTAQTIIGVQITASHTRVDPSGNPVIEEYEFIAKDLSGNISSSMTKKSGGSGFFGAASSYIN